MCNVLLSRNAERNMLFVRENCNPLRWDEMTSQGGLVVINRASHLCDPVSTLARVVGGLSFSRSQSDSEGFSPGTPVFLPPQNRFQAYSIWLWCCAPRSYMARVQRPSA